MVNVQTLHRLATRVLPEVVQTSGVSAAPEDPHALAALLFPLRRKSSGCLRFLLSPPVIEAMASDPLVFLEHALRARQGLGRRQAPFRYRPWRRAFIPYMASGASGEPVGEVYFTCKEDGKALLLVAPGMRMAFYLWNDHDAPRLEASMQRLRE